MTLGERMKLYEELAHPQQLYPLLPVIVRVDGRSFHSFCKGLQRPYDIRLTSLMGEITRILVEETNALIGYQQSDEISLLLYSDDLDKQIYFSGRTQKIISQTAALASSEFNRRLWTWDVLPEKKGQIALFDSRAFNIPTKDETAAYFVWRCRDATRNSLSMAARAYYSQEEVFGKKGPALHDMLMAKGVNWNDYPMHFKQGQFFKKVTKEVTFSPDDLSTLPAKHAAHSNPLLTFRRSQVELVDMPVFDRITNKTDVLFKEVS